MKQESTEKTSKMGQAVALVCFMANFSQLPMFVELGLSSFISIAVWIIFTLYCILYGINIKLSKEFFPFFCIVVIYLLFLCFAEFVSKNNYFSSAIIYPLLLSMFILFLGNNIGDYINRKDLQLIALAYTLGAVIVGGNIFFEYLIDADIADQVYAYGSKNSISQILLTAIVLETCLIMPSRRSGKKILSIIVVGFLGLTILLLKSRATIIAIPVLIIFAFFMGSKKDRYFRWKILGLILAVVAYFVFFPNMYEILINDILLGGRDSSSLDDVSSGRWSEWLSFFEDLGGGWLLGNGRMKRESLILTAILEYGIPMGLMIIGLAMTPLFFAGMNIQKGKTIIRLLFYIAFCYALNSVFEQLAPFGPGVKCYFLWLLFGITLAKKSQDCESILGDLPNEKNDARRN